MALEITLCRDRRTERELFNSNYLQFNVYIAAQLLAKCSAHSRSLAKIKILKIISPQMSEQKWKAATRTLPANSTPPLNPPSSQRLLAGSSAVENNNSNCCVDVDVNVETQQPQQQQKQQQRQWIGLSSPLRECMDVGLCVCTCVRACGCVHVCVCLRVHVCVRSRLPWLTQIQL